MIQLKAYEPGTHVRIAGIRPNGVDIHWHWAILTTEISVRVSDESLGKLEIVQTLQLLAIDTFGADAGYEAVLIETDMYDIEEL